MNAKKLRKEWEKLQGQRANLGQVEWERFAVKLGRKRANKGRGEPQYISSYPNLWPVSIPAHKKINQYTVRSILNALEADLLYLEEHEQ